MLNMWGVWRRLVKDNTYLIPWQFLSWHIPQISSKIMEMTSVSRFSHDPAPCGRGSPSLCYLVISTPASHQAHQQLQLLSACLLCLQLSMLRLFRVYFSWVILQWLLMFPMILQSAHYSFLGFRSPVPASRVSVPLRHHLPAPWLTFT